jgi:hypothetical protein
LDWCKVSGQKNFLLQLESCPDDMRKGLRQ